MRRAALRHHFPDLKSAKHYRPTATRYGVGGSAARYRSAVHEPDRVRAGPAIAPQNVGFAVSIEVADPCNAPGEVRYRSEYSAARNLGGAVHKPDRVIAGRVVVPQDVGLAVCVEVADPRDTPVKIRHRGGSGTARDRSPVHEPDRVIAGRAVVPQDVRLAVSVEVADPRDVPVEVGH